MATVGVYSFEANIDSCGYHEYKETSWSKVQDGENIKAELETSQSSKKVDPYACVIRTKEENSRTHSKRDIYTRIFKTETDFVNGAVISTKFRPSLIPAGGLKISLLLKFLCYKQVTFEENENVCSNFI